METTYAVCDGDNTLGRFTTKAAAVQFVDQQFHVNDNELTVKEVLTPVRPDPTPRIAASTSNDLLWMREAILVPREAADLWDGAVVVAAPAAPSTPAVVFPSVRAAGSADSAVTTDSAADDSSVAPAVNIVEESDAELIEHLLNDE